MTAEAYIEIAATKVVDDTTTVGVQMKENVVATTAGTLLVATILGLAVELAVITISTGGYSPSKITPAGLHRQINFFCKQLDPKNFKASDSTSPRCRIFLKQNNSYLAP